MRFGTPSCVVDGSDDMLMVVVETRMDLIGEWRPCVRRGWIRLDLARGVGEGMSSLPDPARGSSRTPVER